MAAFVECVSDRGSPQPLFSRFTGPPVTVDPADDRPDLAVEALGGEPLLSLTGNARGRRPGAAAGLRRAGSGPMKTLFLTRWRPDRPDGGAQLRNRQNIVAMARLAEVDVLSVGLPETVEPVPGIREWRNFEREARRQPFPGAWLLRPGWHPAIEMYRTPAAEAASARWWRQRPTTSRSSSRSPWRAGCRCCARPVSASVYDAHNVEADLAADLEAGTARRRYPNGFKRPHAAQADAAGRARPGRRRRHRLGLQRVDAEALQRLYAPRRPITVVPNAVDVAAFAEVRAQQAAAPAPDAPIRLVYTGTLSYPPNEDAALTLVREFLPALRAAGEHVRLSLVGRSPTEAITAPSRPAIQTWR